MKILLVDDDDGVRKSLLSFLTNLGHIVLECDNGQETLNILRREKIHLVLSDIRMPSMDGQELLRQIKNLPEMRDVIVILFSGYGDVKGAVEAMRNGAYDYLLKPIDMRELIAVIERVSEYLTIKEEHKKLTEDFDNQVKEVTKEIRKELEDIKKAYAREVGTSEIGLFSDALIKVFKIAQRFHKNPDIPVLIEGETGTGKEVIARYIHYGKGDVVSPFVGINCAAISPALFESEMFGYEAGAFTGGNPKGQKGKLELAKDGTIFLDEISELNSNFQAKLLRVIQEREYYPVGGLKKHFTNTRFICTTNQNVNEMVSSGKFREDLYYRLRVGHIRIPPLRERSKEIAPLARMFLLNLYKQKKTTFREISGDAETIIKKHHWPGNIRELKGTIERISLLWDDTEISPNHLEFLFQNVAYPSQQKDKLQKEDSLDNFPFSEEKFDLNKWTIEIIKKALEKHNWNKTLTAKYLGISRGSLYTYIKLLQDNK